ncbi:hypothetical protein HYDPIDRAFT_120487 [Hydnomerulius pinastri MD-312]|uniref:F-box domain-containing protein n=1 Tax=Hydnomerulius pinastri MD-312 TaxID=994086 RepID=A0A0C9VJQ8_9AGAM|nr:hypothetical protein HYDPIDRAFT_120487 [Hydnomerulius pinastri MD-312]
MGGNDRTISPFSDEEWKILLHYTPRVRELSIDMMGFDRPSDDLSLKVLGSVMFRTTPLLPNLRQLRWSCRDEPEMVYIRPLLTPTITHLEISFRDGDDSASLAVLQIYHILCPNLRSICFEHRNLTTEVSTAVCQAQNLESIDCGRINDTALTHITQSLTLKKFSAQVYHVDSHRILRDIARDNGPDLPPFRNVKVINLHLDDLSFIIPFLKPHYQSFNDMTITFWAVPTTAVLRAFFSALASIPRQGSVRRVKLCHIGWFDGGQTGSHQPLTYESLCPLLSFTRLCELDLELGNPLSLNDEELATLARAWPCLEVLKVNCSSQWRVDPSSNPVTLNGLVSLLRICPMLCELGLPIDAREVPLPSLDPRAPQVPSSSGAQHGSWGIHNAKIKTLHLPESPIKDPASVATFLAELLPSLGDVDTPRPPPTEEILSRLPQYNPLLNTGLHTVLTSPYAFLQQPNPLLPPGATGGPAGSDYKRLWAQVNEYLHKRAALRVSATELGASL